MNEDPTTGRCERCKERGYDCQNYGWPSPVRPRTRPEPLRRHIEQPQHLSHRLGLEHHDPLVRDQEELWQHDLGTSSTLYPVQGGDLMWDSWDNADLLRFAEISPSAQRLPRFTADTSSGERATKDPGPPISSSLASGPGGLITPSSTIPDKGKSPPKSSPGVANGADTNVTLADVLEHVLHSGFSTEAKLLDLLQPLWVTLSTDRFRNISMRVFKDFSDDLASVAQSGLQRHASSLLSKRIIRARIVDHIVDRLFSTVYNDNDFSEPSVAARIERAERIARAELLAAQAQNLELDLNHFLFQGAAFAKMCERIQWQSIPPRHYDIRRDLFGIPEQNIQFCFGRSNRLSDRARSFIEKHSSMEWDWWPHEEPKQAQTPGFCRIVWRCVSLECPN